MLRYFDIRPFILILINLCWIFILNAINSELSPWVYLMLPAIFIAPSAALLNAGWCIFTVAFSALMMEAAYPVRGGMICAIWLLAAYGARLCRFGLGGSDGFSATLTMEILNASVLILSLPFLPNDCLNTGQFLMRSLSDIAFSGIFLLLFAHFSISLPASIFDALGFEKASMAEED